MTIDEHTRYERYQLVEEHLGERGAVLLMEYLPPVGWGDVATKRDLDAHAVLMRHDLDAHKRAMRSDLDTHTRLMQKEFEATRHELRAEMRHEINRLLVWLFPSLLTALGMTAATTIAVARIA